MSEPQEQRPRRECSKCGYTVSMKKHAWNRVLRDDGGFDHDYCQAREGIQARAEARTHVSRAHRTAVRSAELSGDDRWGPLGKKPPA